MKSSRVLSRGRRRHASARAGAADRDGRPRGSGVRIASGLTGAASGTKANEAVFRNSVAPWIFLLVTDFCGSLHADWRVVLLTGAERPRGINHSTNQASPQPIDSAIAQRKICRKQIQN